MDEWTATTWVTAAGLLLAVLGVVVLGVALARQRRTTRHLLETAAAEREAFETRLAALEAPVPAPATGGPVEEFVITEMGAPGSDVRAPADDAVATRIGGRLFADVVLRESVVKAASWTHGVRTALSAENRNRIRFEVKRETKRATRRRKADVKEALRQYYARQDAEEQN
ncbi:hypothetical protein [Nocardioides yefusunii]|uniref:Uncharacterized protein n=1 Tax=Nocardioides yefusunii TaxID=2500546 RepID=A0ABW1R1H3_9ACTN|nr:hypothetical protein [Nocardioides yefusunii]